MGGDNRSSTPLLQCSNSRVLLTMTTPTYDSPLSRALKEITGLRGELHPAPGGGPRAGRGRCARDREGGPAAQGAGRGKGARVGGVLGGPRGRGPPGVSP